MRFFHGRIAQRLERPLYTRRVLGSNPSAPTMTMFLLDSIKIVYEDDDLLVIDKPSGVLTHRVGKADKSPTVVKWLLERYPGVGDIYGRDGEDLEWESLRPGIVHRLDRETSGLMIIAKTQTAFNYLKQCFKERQIKKTYLALVHGQLKNRFGVIDAPIGKYGGRQTTRIVVGRNYLKEKAAATAYRVIQEFQDYSLVQLEPQTGRTHQIRVHLKFLGHPIVCDKLYSPKHAICPSGLDRLFLHSQKLSFTTPAGQALTVEADLSQSLQAFLAKLLKRQN